MLQTSNFYHPHAEDSEQASQVWKYIYAQFQCIHNSTEWQQY